MKILKLLVTFFVFFLLASAAIAQGSDRDQGIDLYREGRFSEAIELLKKSVVADETDRAAWIFLGGAYLHADEESEAANAFERSHIRPTSPQPKYERSVKVTYKPQPRYSEKARRHLSSGTVRIAVEFRADGTIGFTFPLPTTVDSTLIQQSIEAAKGIRFEPATKDGKPVTVINLVEYGFWIG